MDPPPDTPKTGSATPAGQSLSLGHRGLRRLARWLFLFVFIPYLAIIVIFAVRQRSFIYQGTRVELIHVADSRLPDGRVHDVTVSAHDGLTLHGWHVLPAGQTTADRDDSHRRLSDAKWLVLAFPGNSGSRIDRGHELRDFVDIGMHVVLFDYRGYGENPGSPSEESIAADARSIWTWATSERSVPHGRIILFGESLGGGVATRLAADLCRDGTPPAALVLNSTYSSLGDAAAWHYPYLPIRPLLLDRYESEAYIQDVTCPIVVFHGTEDDIVPVEIGRKLFQAAPARSESGIEKLFIEVPHGGHNDVPRSTLQEALRKLTDAIEIQ